MDYYRSTFSSIVWMDSFLFFYWDIRRYRGADAENIDRLIIDFFQRKVPNITSSQDPTPWDTLLCHLMRSLACLLGSRTDPEQPHRRHDWLLREVGEPQRSGSYVDWLALEPIIYRQRPPHPGEQVSALMSYMNTAYEHDRKDPFQWLNTWKGNPFLNEFGHAHQSRYWTMPLPVHVDRLLTIAWKYQSESFMCNRGGCHTGNCQGRITRFNLFPTARLDRGFYLVLQHTANGDMAQLRPCYNDERYCIPIHGMFLDGLRLHADTRVVNLGKRIFTSMLFWVDEMCRTGRLLSFSDILDRRVEEWPPSDAEDTLRVNYELWEAIRNFGLRPVSTKGEVWSDGVATPTKSETLSDIKRYRPEHEKRVDVHIRNFLQELAPSASEDRSPDS
ncbi:hypothetical protein RB213_002835 [Colletotrichum asianum]